jgi:hypothetical protein
VAPYTTTTNGITSFSEWSVGNPNLLPLNLTDFSGQLIETDAHLKWLTSWERDSYSFEIERSLDGQQFSRIGEVPAAGTTTGSREYEFLDRQIVKLGVDVVYYRIKSVDRSGDATYSATVPLTVRWTSVVAPSLYPNPSSGSEAFLRYVSPTATALDIILVDMRGATILHTTRPITKGVNDIDLSGIPSFSALTPGAYTLRVATPGAPPQWVKMLRR